MELEEDILFYAFRYALGRMTYAVNTVSRSIINNWDKLSEPTKETIKKEINEALELERLGMEIDKVEWLKILKL